MAEQTAAVVVEIDALRTSIDGWQDDAGTKVEARRMAIDVADAHLRGGYDVIVPQYLGRTEFIEELEGTAEAAGARFIEVHVHADEDEVVARFDARRADLAGSDHPEQEVDDIRAAVAEAMGRLRAVAGQRPGVATITAHEDEERALAELTIALDDVGPEGGTPSPTTTDAG